MSLTVSCFPLQSNRSSAKTETLNPFQFQMNGAHNLQRLTNTNPQKTNQASNKQHKTPINRPQSKLRIFLQFTKSQQQTKLLKCVNVQV